MKRPHEQLSALQALDRKAPEQVANLRAVTAGWHPDDARWDALVAALDWACRDHAHELAEKIRATDLGGSCAASASCDWLVNAAASLIDPEGNSND